MNPHFIPEDPAEPGTGSAASNAVKAMPACAWRSAETVELARMLLGKVLAVRMENGAIERRAITETEAYHGHDDRASHASRGKTPRTRTMFEAGGVWYVYLCYGVHEMLNLVTGPRDFPGAILIRGVEGLPGPGRVTRGLGIDRRLNGKSAAAGEGVDLWIEDRGVDVPDGEVRVARRVGVDYAGRIWASKPWRFIWEKKRRKNRGAS